MDPLEFLSHDQLIQFFQVKKTEMSCMGEPSTFLNQLRDYNLVPEELYKKVIKMKKKTRIQHGVYEILDWVEKERGALIKTFWECMFKDHIMHQYPIFQVFKNSMLDRPLIGCEKLPDVENPSRNEEVERKNEEQKKSLIEQQKSTKESDGEKPGPSSASSQENPTVNPSLSLLPVTCGDKKGMLCPDKFAKGEKCILTEGHWFTTGDFERISGKGGNKNWKLSIRYQNVSLLTLLKEGQLQYPLNAKADIRKVKKRKNLASCCVEKPAFQNTTGAKRKFRKPLNPPDLQLEQVEDLKCFICNEEEKLVHCTECSRAFHHRCHLPPLEDQTPGGNWMCTFCVFKENQQFQNQAQRKAVLSSPISENLTHCQYLLLCLYKGDHLHVFNSNPTGSNMEWSPVISEPMWLNKVKNKLQFNMYRTVEEFVNDIHLIFNNCRVLNRDNEFGTMGAKLQQTFEREFQWIFNIK